MKISEFVEMKVNSLYNFAKEMEKYDDIPSDMEESEWEEQLETYYDIMTWNKETL